MTEDDRDQRIPGQLAELRDAMRPLRAPDRVEEALLRQFRKQRKSPVPHLAWRQLGKLAAAVVTVVLAVLMMRLPPEVPEPARGAPQEIATDFLPIGYGTPLAPDEFAQVIRVSVPRSDLAQFGLPVRFDEGPERVTADIVLGEDGIARAVRFVH